MPKMIALKRRRYESKLVNVNDIFDVRSKDVRLLKAMKWATDYVEPPSMVSTVIQDPLLEAVHSAMVEHRAEASNEEPVQIEEPQDSPDPKPEEYTNANVEEETSQEVTVEEEMPQPVQTEDHFEMLRARAISLGIHVDGRWSYSRLQREIDEYNKRTYQRTDLRAEE